MTDKITVTELNELDIPSAHEKGLCEDILIYLSYLLCIVTFPISWVFCIAVVKNYERAIIFRLGRLDTKKPTVGPGVCFVLPCIDIIEIVDLRIFTYDIPVQEVLTKDSVTVMVNAIMNYFVFSPKKSVCNAASSAYSTKMLAQTALRNVLGTKDLTQILSEKVQIGEDVRNILMDSTSRWGVEVTHVEIRDVQLPSQMQRAMAAEAEAVREARAKIVAAEGEQQAARALSEAAQIMAKSPNALQLRYLQSLCTISAEKNSTIIFPLPMDLLPKPKTT